MKIRLLSTRDLRFKECDDDKIPKYAILSHRWEGDEPSYSDMKTVIAQRDAGGHGQELWQTKTYNKIYRFSRMALKAGFKYIWVDSCCIDKSSSAELQESINSMYRWYLESDVCYAYLSDVSISTDYSRHRGSASSKLQRGSFQNSCWFTRGWTLQELLAPRELIFFDKDWNKCGDRVELQDAIQAATGIDSTSLIEASHRDGGYLRSVRLGRLFSWAANRQTTRYEDRAYSLLGIFDVNMPLLYGEKDKAFYRLQEEIIKVNEDVSLLAWNYTDADDGFAPNGLAKSPSQFQNYQNLTTKDNTRVPYVPFSPRLIARGLQATLKITSDPFENKLGYAVLAHEKDRRSLVLPVLFCSLTFARTPIQNECVRFSDPIWVPSRFIDEAKPRSICFIRHVEATNLYEPGDGLSLGSAVWKNYTIAFTYPVQTRAGRRHFPTLLGRFPADSEQRQGNYTFVVELVARNDTKRRYVVIVDYWSDGTTITDNMTVTVVQRRWHINLAYALELVQRRQTRWYSKSCKLPDEYGNGIPTGEIIYISHLTSLWVSEAENKLNKLNQPPTRLLNAISRLRSLEASRSSGMIFSVARSIARLQARYSNSERNWSYPGENNDLLFKSGYDHEEGCLTCARCDSNYLEERPQRGSTQPKVHYGTIASANRVMRNGAARERLRSDKNALCVEMEAAGLMNNFHCLVIRGICDYADSHKNKDWQLYAAAAAAAYAKELLSVMPNYT